MKQIYIVLMVAACAALATGNPPDAYIDSHSHTQTVAEPHLSGGTWFDTTFTAQSLGFSNQVRIYLPEGYDPQGSTDYPVI